MFSICVADYSSSLQAALLSDQVILHLAFSRDGEKTNFRLITARLRKTNILPSQLTPSPLPPSPTHDPRNKSSVFSTQQIICKMAAATSSSLSATWMSHPTNALCHKMTDSCIMKRRDKQRQVTVLWPVARRLEISTHCCSNPVSTRVGLGRLLV